ncbi:MAG: uracil-DNA glycosylase family protein [Flavobacteriales bacterium]|nr:uracil-DNA glycosylase family protein [Flavobacteriales bacterium]
MAASFTRLLIEILKCEVCKAHLPLGPNPILRANPEAKILIIGQAPGTKVHHSGIPWTDPSGNNLRTWLGVDKEMFYNAKNFAIMPMGFCYPGKGNSGDLPPRIECAPLWHERVLKHLLKIELILLVGSYSINHYLGDRKKETLTETVKNFRDYLPKFFPLVHPSPRNIGWVKRNPWFMDDAVVELRKIIQQQLQ